MPMERLHSLYKIIFERELTINSVTEINDDKIRDIVDIPQKVYDFPSFKRKSKRDLSKSKMDFKLFIKIINCACGTRNNGQWSFPRAGGVREIRLVITAKNVENLKPDKIYEFIPEKSHLEILTEYKDDFFLRTGNSNLHLI